MNTTSDVTRSLNSVSEPEHNLLQKVDFGSWKKHLLLEFDRNNVTIILSTFETEVQGPSGYQPHRWMNHPG